MQDRESISINSRDTSISRSKQLELAIPRSKISSLSSGEFVGMIADNPDHKIELKTFNAEVLNDHNAIAPEQKSYKDLPPLSNVSHKEILDNYLQIKKDILTMLQNEIERVMDTPDLADLIVKKD